MITLIQGLRSLTYYEDGIVPPPVDPPVDPGGGGGTLIPDPPTLNYPAFPTSIRAVRGAQKNTVYRSRSSVFGGGYWDSSADGLNPETFTLSPTFRGLNLTRRNQLNTFIRNVGGHRPFYFLMDGNVFGLFSLLSISETSMGGDYWEITMELQNRYRADG